MKRFAAATSAALLAVAALCVPAIRADAPATQPAAGSANYPLDVCVMSGEKLDHDGTQVVEIIDGREVHFCCPKCAAKFKADPVAGNKKMDDLIIASQKDSYPLQTCVISGEKLGEMAPAVMYVDHKSNRLIELCCKSCVKDVEKDPAAAVAKIDAAKPAAAH